jgi:hypothetical protein
MNSQFRTFESQANTLEHFIKMIGDGIKISQLEEESNNKIFLGYSEILCKLTKGIECFSNLVSTTNALTQKFFLLSNANRNNSYHFLKFFKEFAFYDFCPIENECEPSIDEMQLVQKSDYSKHTRLDTLSALKKGDFPQSVMDNIVNNDILRGNNENIEDAYRIIKEDRIGLMTELMFKTFFSKEQIAFELIKFLHHNGIGIVKPPDINIPIPTENEIALFTRFHNNGPFDSELSMMQKELRRYAEDEGKLFLCFDEINTFIKNNQ